MEFYTIKRLFFVTPSEFRGSSSPLRVLIFLLAFITLVFCFYTPTVEAGQLEWKNVFNPPLESDCFLNDVVYGKGGFVTVGEKGVIMFTNDGGTWIRGLSDNKSDLLNVSYGNGVFVAVGDKVILYSNTGIYWEKANFKNPSKVHDVVFGDGKFVAVCDNGDIINSIDGINWNNIANFKNRLLGIGYANGKYTVTSPAINLISEDGFIWNIISSNSEVGTIAIIASIYKDNKYWGIGMKVFEDNNKQSDIKGLSRTYWAVSSSNGYNWNVQSLQRGVPSDIIIDNSDKYIVEGIGALAPDGKVGPLTIQLDLDKTHAALGNGRLVAVLKVGNMKTYVKGQGWVKAKVGYGLRSLTYGNGKFVAAGNNTVVTSEDGEKWTPRGFNFGQKYEIKDLIFSNGRFVAVGNCGILESTDGIQWKEASLPVTKPSFAGIAYGKGVFVAAGETTMNSGQGLILTSPDGVIWTWVESKKGPAITGITFGRGKFAAWDSKGAFGISRDGVNWSEVELPTGTGAVRNIAYGNGRFVAISEKKILMSLDGIKWTSAIPDFFQSVSPTKVMFVNNNFVIPYFSNAYKSKDGVTWESGDKYDAGVVDVAYVNGTYVALNNKDSIMFCRAGEPPATEMLKEEGEASPQTELGEIIVTINGKYLIMDQPPVRVDGRTLVPMRNIFEALGAKVVWNEEAQTVMATRKDKIITFRVGNSNVIVSDKQMTMEPLSQVVNGRTMVPVRFVSEVLGARVDWDEAANTVRITTN